MCNQSTRPEHKTDNFTLTKMNISRHKCILATAALLLAAILVALPRSACAQTPTVTVLHDLMQLGGSYPTNGLLLASD
jgi:hypothetical protein